MTQAEWRKAEDLQMEAPKLVDGTVDGTVDSCEILHRKDGWNPMNDMDVGQNGRPRGPQMLV